MFHFDADENKRELWGGYKANILDQIAKLISLKRNILDPKLDLYRGIHAGVRESLLYMSDKAHMIDSWAPLLV
jgi:hypothetical protein